MATVSSQALQSTWRLSVASLHWAFERFQMPIRLNDRGKERFRETLVELSIETNFNFFKMNVKQVQKYSWPTD